MRFLPCLLGAALSASLANAEQSAISPDTRAAFEWFSGLGVSAVKGLPFVEVWTGGTSQSHTRRVDPMITPALLVGDADGKFTILTPGLQEQEYAQTEKRPGAATWVHYEPKTLDDFARRFLEPQKEDDFAVIWYDDMKPDAPATMFILGWICWQNGRDDLAEQFIVRAEAMLRRHSGPPDPPTLREKIEPHIADHFFNLLIMAFGDPHKTREQLLERLESYAAGFPGQKNTGRAAQLAEGLRSLIAEEKSRPAAPGRDLSQLPPGERAKELVHRLRDQGLPQEKPEDNAIGELMDIGEPAVPALIEELDDHRPSRSAGFMRWEGVGEARLESIGDLAERTIGLISDRQFRHAGSASVFSPSPEQPSDLRKEVEEWWATYQSMGARQFLVDAVSGGGDDAVAMAGRLLREYPKAAGDAVVRGYKEMSTVNRTNLIYGMKTLHHPGWIALMEQEVRKGRTLELRAAAAWCLRELGGDANEPMIEQWQKLLGTAHGDGSEEVVRFLASSSDESIVAQLTKNLRKRPVHVRFEVIDDLAGAYESNVWNRNQPTPPKIQKRIEDELAACLDDDQEAVGLSGLGYRNPSVGDEAARCLTSILPAKYRFDIGASWEERAAARLECINQWRKSSGLDPLPPSNPPYVPDSDRNKIVEVHFADDRLDGSAPGEALEKLKGQTLNPEDLIRILCDFGEHLPKGVRGLRIRAARTAQPNGVMVKVWSAAGGHLQSGEDFWWDAAVDCNGKELMGSSGSRQPQDIGRAEEWQRFEQALNTALAGPPNQELLVRAAVWLEK